MARRRRLSKRKSRNGAAGHPDDGLLGLVLLPHPYVPEAESVVSAFRKYALGDEALRVWREAGEPSGQSGHVFTVTTGEIVTVFLLPARVPDPDTEEHMRFSCGRYQDDWKRPEYRAYLVVWFDSHPGTPRWLVMSRFIAVVAAVMETSRATGVYWLGARATHTANYFLRTASEHSVAANATLWSGFACTAEDDGQFGFLSLGMSQLDMPDVLVMVRESSDSDALTFLYDIIHFLARRGKPFDDGDVFVDDDEREFPIRYVPSPLQPKKLVARFVLP
ncbi:MAG: hypothetical protein KatS3mg109_1922 [Pirellulaceae bacterium]|nr:MAG: hypothetical protein KatS3mg109_1922 [Pirellulaceae bacterium]GIW95805.1 MAG: hypothetical protein KatS3mg110_3846 [Pirellulaceae bacterium]